jgi:hypothetical protein
VLRQRRQLQPQLRRQVVEIGRLVRRLLPVPQDEVEDAGGVEVTRVERRARTLRQDELVGLSSPFNNFFFAVIVRACTIKLTTAVIYSLS